MSYKDREKQREYARKWIQDRRASFFADKVCAVCGSKEKLELDHINPEEKVTHNIWSWSKERREREIAKCQVLCEKHHKVKTVFENYGNSLYQCGTISSYKRGCRCPSCRLAKKIIRKEH